ncbi:hypothetical protein ACFYU9_00325 [Streptomyces sp. NPDC004327]|uniref:hypothetical protein n=1 Tax=unclassified Streptomyces TaxID=2593676 RepID=UPI00368F63D2
MSYGMAYPSIAEIVPTVDYSGTGYLPGTGDVVQHSTGTLTDAATTTHGALTDSALTHDPVSLGQLADSARSGAGHAAGHAVDGVNTAATHALDAAGHALHQLLEPAAVALGALSGALFVGRAAMVATHVLAAAAVKAADEQRCLEQGQRIAAAVTAQWEHAAFAAVRANARRTALLARVRRAAFRTRPDTPPPPQPDLPPPLTCTGTPLAELRGQLALMEEALGRAEAAQARWTMEQALHTTAGAEDAEWRGHLLARREAAVRARQADPVSPAAELPRPPAADGLDRRKAEESGAELLALLEPGADPKDAELALAAVRHAVESAAERPAKARIHLREARRFVADANRAVRARLAACEKAAVQLDLLLTRAPTGEPPLAPAAAEVELLRAVIEEGRQLDADEQRAVDRKVEERLTDLECRYTRELLGVAVTRLADPAAAGRAAAPEDADGPLCFDLTPAGWWPGHWLRITVRDGTTELVTMYAEHDGPRTAADLALDRQRCQEARGHLEELREAGRRWGIDLRGEFTETGTAVAGVRGGDGAIVLGEGDEADLDGTRTSRRRPDADRPRARTVGDDQRSTRR